LSGRTRPLSLKPVPVTAALEMVTSDPPEFFNVSDWVLLLPTCTLPKLRAVGAGATMPAVVGEAAVPESETTRVELAALLTTVRLPTALPVVLGAYTTFTDRLWPAARVIGKLVLGAAKPVPLAAAWLTTTDAVPELVSTTDLVIVLPTCAVPKLTAPGLAASWPVPLFLRTALPARAIFERVTDGLVVNSIVPHSFDDPRGVNLMLNWALVCGGIVIGRAGETIVKSLPLTVADRILRFEELQL
jgi:hypothetical protein